MDVDDLRTGTWITYIGGRARGVRVRRCRVDVLAGPDKGMSREIESSSIRVGARKGNELQLSDSGVSGLHFEITLDDRGYRLTDLDSTNGTFVGGLRVNDIYINPETVIQIGSTKLRFQPLSESISCIASATSSLPTPVSPVIKTVASEGAIFSKRANSSRILTLSPTMPP